MSRSAVDNDRLSAGFIGSHDAMRFADLLEVKQLGQREMEMVQRIAAGKSNKEIGAELFCAHLRNLARRPRINRENLSGTMSTPSPMEF